MKANPSKIIPGEGVVDCPIEEATHIIINRPGPSGHVLLPVQIKGTRDGTGNWTWNGDTERPTLRPSILTTGGTWKCHTWITDGKAIFLPDSTHEFSGQTLDLLDADSL